MTTTRRDYRLRITVGLAGAATITYLTRTSGRVAYFSGSEVPLALSNLVGGEAAELRFALADALSADRAAKCVRDALTRKWANSKATVLVEVL